MKRFIFKSRLNCQAVIIYIFLLVSAGAYSQGEPPDDPVKVQKKAAIVPNSEEISFHSAIFDQDFLIFIQLPMSYNQDSARIYPVMYVTDANRNFPMVANISILLGFPRTDFPEVIVVGIGYRLQGMEDWSAWRTRDLTPTNVPSTDRGTQEMLKRLSGREIYVKSGGAEKFLEFILTELTPHIESNYHVSSSDRALGGYSFGGLFTLYALFRRPEAFRLYFAGSPIISWDKGVLYRFEEECSLSHTDINAKLFMTAGSLESQAMINNIDTLKSRLMMRNYPNLSVEAHVFDGETHVSCYPSAFMRAFTTLYK